MSAAVVAGVALAGGAGAVARAVLDGVVSARRPGPFPLPTLLVNVSGSLLLGLLTGLALAHGLAPGVRTVLGTGFCGGYTTFSTASLASLRLGQAGRPGLGTLNAVATLVLSTAAAALGLALTGGW